MRPSPRMERRRRGRAPAGRPAVLPRASSAAEASSSATARTVERMTRPSASGWPRRSSSGSEPGHADGHVDDAEAPRPPERVRHDDRQVVAESRSRIAARMARRRRVRVGRQEGDDRSPSAGPTFEASMPPLAHTNPCGVSVMITPLAIRTMRRASRRTTSTWRGVAVPALGELDGLRSRLDGRQVDDRALGLATRSSGSRPGRRRRAAAGRRRVAAASGVGDQRRAGRRRARSRRGPAMATTSMPSAGSATDGLRRPRPGPGAGPRACRGRRPAARRARRRSPRRRGPPRRGRRGCRRRTSDVDDVGRGAAAARSCRGRGGRRRWRRAAGRWSVERRRGRRSTALGRDARQVDGQDEHRAGAAGDGLVAGLAQPGVEPVAALAERSGAGVEGERADLVVGRHDERLGDGRPDPDRGPDGRLGEARHEVAPLLGVEDRAQPRLGAVERPDRDDRDDAFAMAHGSMVAGTTGQSARSASSSAAEPGPAGVAAHDRVGDVDAQPGGRDRVGQAGIDVVDDEVGRRRRRTAGRPRARSTRGRARRASGRPGP